MAAALSDGPLGSFNEIVMVYSRVQHASEIAREREGEGARERESERARERAIERVCRKRE